MLKLISPESAKVITNPLQYIRTFLYIRDKDGIVRPFILNRFQTYYYRLKQKAIRLGKALRFLVLKSRQGGITTLEQALNFHKSATLGNQEVVTLSHDKESTEKIFRIAQMFYRLLPEDIKPIRFTEHKQELNFPELNSLLYIGTAGNKGFGRGQTLQRVHCSEVTLWRGRVFDVENLITGLTEAASRGEMVMETTARGVGGWFHQTWEEAKGGGNEWTPIFLPWFVDTDNSIPLLKGEEIIADDEELDFIRRVKKEYGLDIYAEQIKFRRVKKHAKKKLFPQEYPEDDVTCFIVSGINFFDVDKIQSLAKKCRPPIETRDGGQVVIWKKPIPGHKYVAGGDVGEGLPTSDFSGIGILDRATCEQVASLHGRWRPEIFARKAVPLCVEYNRALLGIEANNHGHSALNTAKNVLHYTRLYYHTDYDAEGNVKAKLGWQTNLKTRPIMLDDIVEAINNNVMQINDSGMLSECLTFQDNGKGKYEATEGHHDDRIIKWAIAYQLRNKGFGAEPRVSVV